MVLRVLLSVKRFCRHIAQLEEVVLRITPGGAAHVVVYVLEYCWCSSILLRAGSCICYWYSRYEAFSLCILCVRPKF